MVATSTIFFYVELGLSILGLILTAVGMNRDENSSGWNIFLLLCFVVVLVYMIFIIVCYLSNKQILSDRVRVIIELAAAITTIIAAIIVTTKSPIVWLIIAVIDAFVLACVLAVTAYDKM